MLRLICKYSFKDQVESDHIDFFRTQIILRWPQRIKAETEFNADK